MSNEAMEYAKALAAELDHLDQRWEAANETLRVLDREITAVRDKMVEVVRGLGGVVVIGSEVYLAQDDGRLVALEAVVAGQPQGQGYYDPATQSVVRWHRFRNRTPQVEQYILILTDDDLFPGYLTATNPLTWRTDADDQGPLSPENLWAELPQPPRGDL